MNIWENAVVTIQGLSLLSKLTEGNTLNITKAETGESYVTPGLLNQLTAVAGPKQQLSFRTISYPEQGKCKLPCYLTNAGLASGYTAKQVGVYATDPDEGEILFLIVQAPSDQGTVIPSEAEMVGYSAEWNLYFQYGQASSVSVTVDPSNSITREELFVIIESEISPEKIGAAPKEHGHMASDIIMQKGSEETVEEAYRTILADMGVISVDVENLKSNAAPKEHTHFGSEIDLYGDGSETAEEAMNITRHELGLLSQRVGVLESLLPDYGTEDLEAGVTPLQTGKMYLVYE